MIDDLKNHPPRAIAVAREAAGPPRTARFSDLQVSRRIEPVLGLVATGDIPIDGHEGGIGRAIERVWERQNATDSSAKGSGSS